MTHSVAPQNEVIRKKQWNACVAAADVDRVTPVYITAFFIVILRSSSEVFSFFTNIDILQL